jgi:hypothetical protein
MSFVVARVTIASGGNLSQGLTTNGLALVGIYTPTGYEAEGLVLLGSIDNSNFARVYNNGRTLLSFFTGSQSAYFDLTLGEAYATVAQAYGAVHVPYLKLQSVDDAGAAQNVGADRTFGLVLAKV